MQQFLVLPGYLALREIWRNRGRFLLVAVVIALITILVLFIAALGEGLGNGNREYISKLDAQLVVYQAKSDFVIGVSRLPRDRVNAVRRVEGVEDAGPIGFANLEIILPDKAEPLKVAMIGVEPGHAGEPKVIEGQQLSSDLAQEVLLDRNVILRSNLKLGDTITIRATQGTQDEFYTLTVVGITSGQQYFLQPSIIVPFFTWDRMRPKAEAEVGRSDGVSNVIAVRLKSPADLDAVRQRLEGQVSNVEAATIKQAIEAAPGYTAQQLTIQTQGAFSLVIGALVIGGFFQIQILQKVPQIGVLKAIGASNWTVGAAAVIQIVIVTAVGVAIGRIGTGLLALGLPPIVPIVFSGQSTAFAVIALLLIGPIGGLVSVRYAIQIEPLKALGLSS
jgi:putative ABC transport system permease protein